MNTNVANKTLAFEYNMATIEYETFYKGSNELGKLEKLYWNTFLIENRLLGLDNNIFQNNPVA